MAPETQPPVLYEKRPDRVAIVTLNRPQALNACNREMGRMLAETWREVARDEEVSVVVLTGAGDRAFCVGADLKEMAARTAEDAPPPQDVRTMLETWDLDLWKPIICAVNGYALGSGVNMVMATDIRIASEDATFGLSQIKWGLVSGHGTQLLPRLVSYSLAMEMLLTGENITAQRAYEIGLVNRVTPQERLMDEALALARKIAGYAPLALQRIKEAAVRGLNFNLKDAIVWGLRMEELNAFTEDAKEGPRAFSEKRQPQWKGR
ncbi:MAG: enoyl-CoA hydratase-related protein [Dehalococcoidia bacterium]